MTPIAMEVSPATFDELEAKIKAAGRGPLDLGGIGLKRGPIPPVLLPTDEVQAIYNRTAGVALSAETLCFVRAIEYAVLRRVAQRRRASEEWD